MEAPAAKPGVKGARPARPGPQPRKFHLSFAAVCQVHTKNDLASVGYLKLHFKEKTGRELIVESPKKVVKPPVDDFPADVENKKVSAVRKPQKTSQPLPIEEELKPYEGEIERFEAYKKEERKPKVFRRKRTPENPWGAAASASAASLAKENKPTPMEKDDDATVKKTRGRGRAPKVSGGRSLKTTSQSGGGGAQKSHSRYRNKSEEKETQERREAEVGGALQEKIDTETGLKIEILRVGLNQHEEREKEDRGGQDSSTCATCGTSLPPSQAQSCPICAQSGQDIMALAKTGYRFAGTKMLATVDTVVASEGAKKLFESGQMDHVVSLRYWPEIPGHKEIWNLRKTQV